MVFMAPTICFRKFSMNSSDLQAFDVLIVVLSLNLNNQISNWVYREQLKKATIAFS